MISTQDAKQRWERSVLRAAGEVVCVSDVHEVTKGGVVIFDGVLPRNTGWEPVLRKIPFAEMNEECPELGNVAINDSCFYVSRRATHQFRRGYVPSQMVVDYIHPLPRSLDRATIRKHDLAAPEVISPILINALFNNTFLPMMEAVRLIRSGERLVAPFHRNLSISASASRWPVVYYKTHLIGKVKGDTVILGKEAAPFYEMVQEKSPLPVQVGE